MGLGLGFFLFARRYLGNTYLSLFLLVLRCFTSQGTLLFRDRRGLLDGVSPFGNLRIKGCYAPPRSLSQLRYVLHRLLKSRHPPYALKFPVKKFTNHFTPSLFMGGEFKLLKKYISTARDSTSLKAFSYLQ